ncbi:MAG TPA: hypothetical protein VE961_21780 [Pyrinomonadaceae bacterium]|nr:hypothetical protein [Pyrinomonadaceae bacterium]
MGESTDIYVAVSCRDVLKSTPHLKREGRRTNRWTGTAGTDFRIKRDPAQLLGSAVVRSTPPLGILS